MTQKSWPWSTVAALGDGATQLSEADSRLFLATWFGVQNPATEGVSKGVGGELAVTGVASPLSVASGSGVCYGLYINDAALATAAIATPAVGTTGGRVVLQTNWGGTGGALQAMTRVAVKKSADGVAAIPALTQAVGTTWEISLATFTITTGGVIALTDDRTFRKSTALATHFAPLAVLTASLAANVVSFAKMVQSAAAGLSVVGRSANSAGDFAEIVAGTDGHVLRRSGTTLGFGTLVAASYAALSVVTAAINDLAVTTGKIANDAVDDTKAGARVLQFYRRQGASATDWSLVGTGNQTPVAVRMQAGSVKAVITAGLTMGQVTVTFPVAFSNKPIVIQSVQSAYQSGAAAVAVKIHTLIQDGQDSGLSTTQAVINVMMDVVLGYNLDVDLSWLAIGPE